MASINPLTLWNFLNPASETEEDLRKWRTRLAFTVSLVVLTLLICGILVPIYLGQWMFPRAEAEEIHQEIQAELAGIKSDLGALVQSDQARAEREKAREIREVREAILSLQLRVCQTEGELRAALVQQVGQLRSDYMELTGIEFPETPCTDLLGL